MDINNELAQIFINKQKALLETVLTEKLFLESQLEMVTKRLEEQSRQALAIAEEADKKVAEAQAANDELAEARKTLASQNAQIEEHLAQAVRLRQELAGWRERAENAESQNTRVTFERDRLKEDVDRLEGETKRLAGELAAANTPTPPPAANETKRAARRNAAG